MLCQVGQCVETLYADCHLSLSSLTTLCSMLSHSLRLTSHFGLTDDTEHSNDVNQVSDPYYRYNARGLLSSP